MRKQRMLEIAKKLRRSRAYTKLEYLVAFFEENILTRRFARKLKKSFIILKRRINAMLLKMKQRGVPDAQRMFFYRMLRRFLPAFSKAMSLNI